VSRIPLIDAFRKLVEKAGLTPEAAVAEIYQQTSRSDGELDLYCNGNRPPRDYILEFLEFKLGDNAIVVIGPIGAGGRGRVDHVYAFELDADQVKARIAKLTAPPPPPPKRKRAKSKPTGRKAWALGRLRELIKAGDEKATIKVLREYQKKFGKVLDPLKRDSLRRNIDRWRTEKEAEIAAEIAVGKNPGQIS
jgi:hypothetical protein